MSGNCTICRSNPRWYDQSSNTYSPYCSNTCRFASQKSFYQPKPASQGQPLCQMCHNAAYYENGKWSPGCTKTHSLEARKLGFTNARF